MALDTQINLYSVDTGHFYSGYERYLQNMNHKYRQERNYLKNKNKEYEDLLYEYGYTESDLRYVRDGDFDKVKIIIPNTSDILYQYIYWNNLIVHKRKKAEESKEKLLKILKNKVHQNIVTKGKDHIRSIKSESIKDTDVVSLFDSSLTRMIEAKQDELNTDLIIVQIYYFDIFKDLLFNGFMFNGEKYRYYTSSAGQIRKKKAVFIKESTWNKYEKTIMCGLTIDKINEKGGNNVNKHLAYLALVNSATDLWAEFDIDKTIVVDDFETDVFGTYDFIDETDYSITRKDGYVPITHSDGCGMVLPSYFGTNTMFRAPWIKGLLAAFDYVKFIEANGYSPVIKDIYGKEYDVIKDDIRIIFTKSQFKMWKYYESWDEYKQYFKQYNCTAGLCNTEEKRIKNARTNYQMLQTMTDITDKEIFSLTQKSVDKIVNLCTSEEHIKEALGITPYNTNMTSFQKAIKIYPALLNDTYAKDIIREIKNSLLKKYRSGKLEINGKYTFILPDLYAACEYWFGHIEQPKGLLGNKEVFCWLFRKYDKLDCLRSPHLYKEHAIRTNVANEAYNDRVANIREWFTTNALYTSSWDLISKVLQFDVDGDKSLVVADQEFIRIAERNMEGIVPLYYNMRKASPKELDNESIYEGLNAAFTGGNIGMYSNDISKIWNSDIFINGSEYERQEAIDAVKLLCCENNFVIDYAKTLYKPVRPKEKNKIINKFTRSKLPAFFEFAKDKELNQVEKRNQSFVNKLYDIIPNKAINMRKLNIGELDYKLLMNNVHLKCDTRVKKLYDELNEIYRYKINMKDGYGSNFSYIFSNVRKEFEALGYDLFDVTDMLVSYLYGSNKRYKQLLWYAFGDYIVENIERNVSVPATKYVQCIDCGEWIEIPVRSKSVRCESCQKEYKKAYQRELMRKRRCC